MSYSNELQPWRLTSVRAWLLLATIEGLLAVGSIFWTRSMERNAFFLGYSLARIAVGLTLLGVVALLALATVRSFTNHDVVRRFVESMDSRVASSVRRLLGVTYGLFLISAAVVYTIILFQGRFVEARLSFLQAAVDRSTWIILWPGVMLLQSLGLLMSWYRDRLLKILSEKGAKLRLVMLAVLTVAVLQWITLVLQADWLYLIPGWFWRYHPKRFAPRDAYLVLAIVLALALARIIMRHPSRHARTVLMCIGLVFLMQAAFGFADGQGFESLRLKYVQTPLSDELRLACEYQAGPLEAVRTYEAAHGGNFWLGTKPPGLFAFYVALRDITGSFVPAVVASSNDCFAVLSRLAMYLMPILAAAVVVPLSAMQRTLSPVDVYVPALLYACVPSVLLMPLIPDQFLFPLLFALAAALLTKAIVGRSVFFGLLSGASLYLCVFVSFSLLPVLALGLVWFLAEIVRGDEARRTGLILSAIGMCFGVVVLWLALELVANYNPIVRLVAALAAHRLNMNIAMTPGSVIGYASVNIVEFALWSGLPLIVLTVAGVAGSVMAFLRRPGGGRPALAIAYGVCIFGLFVGGQTQGEVGRLWIFLLPLACIFAAPIASRMADDRPRGIMMIMAFQLITSCLMFLYMDFR